MVRVAILRVLIAATLSGCLGSASDSQNANNQESGAMRMDANGTPIEPFSSCHPWPSCTPYVMTSQEVLVHTDNETAWTLEYHVSLWYRDESNVSLQLRPARDSPFQEPPEANWNRIYDLEQDMYYTMLFEVPPLPAGTTTGSLVLDFRARPPDNESIITRWLITVEASDGGGWTVTTDDHPACPYPPRCWWDPDESP